MTQFGRFVVMTCCASFAWTVYAQSTIKDAKMLTVNDARVALISLVESLGSAPLKMSLESLRNDQVVVANDGSITIGRWRINLDNRTFAVAIDAGPIFEEYSGSFIYKEGKWIASINRHRRN